MTSRWVKEIIENALDENRELLPELLGNAVDADDLLSFCANFRVAAIGALFLTGRSEPFLRHLQKSALAYAALLPRVADDARLTSRSAPFFDALAAAEWGAAAAIAAASRRTWAPGDEYEEDFLFPEFLMQVFFLGASPTAAPALLARWETALQGSEDHRLGACRALVARDQEAFSRSLEAFVRARRDENDEIAERSVIPEETLGTEWNLCVEGVALVRLAERAGIPTEPDYLHVPSIARELPGFALDRDAWRDVT
jgi:hypothetical protein